MRTKSFSLLALAAVFTLSACGGSQNSNSNPAASGAKAAGLDVNKTYIVATDASYAPMEYMENNAVVGFSHDILDAAAKSQNVKLEFVNTPFKGLFANVDKGDSDIGLASITINDERKQQLDFSDPFTPRPHGKSSLAINQDPNNGILNVGHTVADTVEINGHTYGNNSTLDIGHNFQNRLSDFTYVLKQSGRNVESGQLGVYKRAYSAVVGATVQDRYNPNTGAHASSPNPNFSIRSIQGDLTPESRLPTLRPLCFST